MTAIQILNKLKAEKMIEEYPNVPLHAIVPKKYSDNSANALTNCVIDFLILSGQFAERTGTEGRVVDNRKTYVDTLGQRKTIGTIKRIPTSGTKGSSDIKAVINGRMIAIEIKYGKDRQSDVQKDYQAKVERAGGVYLIVRNFQEFYDWYIDFNK